MKESNRAYSIALDCCRWMAAWIVVIHHVRHVLFAESEDLPNKSALLKAVYFATGLGDEAVIVFFVLSGLLVGGGALKKYLEGRYDATDYAIHRFARIYTVLIPALAIGGLLDMIGSTYFDRSTLYAHYQQPLSHTGDHLVASRLTGDVLLGNLLMTQNWLVPVFGSNGPLWSLTSEWWFYALFWAILGMGSTSSTVMRVGYGALAAVMIYMLPVKVLWWFSIWLFGVALAFTDRVRLRIPVWVGVAALGAALVMVRLARASNWWPDMNLAVRQLLLDWVIALGFAVLLLALSKIRRFALGSEVLHQRLAGFSYTTYLVHFPMMMIIVALAAELFGVPFHQAPGLFSGLYLAMLVAILISYGYLVSTFTEAKTTQVRQWLSKLCRFFVPLAPTHRQMK